MATFDRMELHRRLDEILDQRLLIESGLREPAPGKHVPETTFATYADVAQFAADVCGPFVIAASFKRFWPAADNNSAVLLALRDRLRVVRPLIEFRKPTYEVAREGDEGDSIEFKSAIDWVRDELLALAQGDASTLFKRRRNTPKNSIVSKKLARAQIRACEWEAYLRSSKNQVAELEGASPGTVQLKVASAFGETWDTIRKWKKPCKEKLGELRVNTLLAAASTGFIDEFEGEYTLEALQRDGDVYQKLKWVNPATL